MSNANENPYASPAEAAGQLHDRRTDNWQVAVAKAIWLIPLAIVCHGLLFGLNYVSLVADGTLLEVVAIGLGLCLYVISLVYHGWLGALLYGTLVGMLLAMLAAFPAVGLLALAIFYRRARTELQSIGWQVVGLQARRPAKTA